MATGVVVRGILLAADEQLRVEELAIVAGADLVDGGGVEVAEDGTRHVFAAGGFAEEGLEGALLADMVEARVGLAVGAKAVLEEVELPSAVTQLHAGLA